VTALVGDIAQDPALGTLPVVVPLARTSFERGLAARKALIDGFIDRRLLRVRPTHDALLRTWPEAVRIIAEQAALIRVRHTLEPMAADWHATEAAAKPGHLVTSAVLLAGAEQLRSRLGEDLPASMRAYIAGALAADRARRDIERRRQRRALSATAGGLVIALILASLAGWQWQVANREKAAAQRTLALATQTANGLIFEWQRDLSVSDSGIGDVLQAQGDLSGALAAYREELAIAKVLVGKKLGNTQWQRDLSVSDERIGGVLQAQGDLAGAIAAYRDEHAITKALAYKDPDNTDWQTDVVVSLYKMASAGSDSRSNLSEALAILKRLDAAGRLPPDKKGWIATLETALKKT
jgi:tetratricopeptide (TPR) repeat protein